jgi:hypothetical protein
MSGLSLLLATLLFPPDLARTIHARPAITSPVPIWNHEIITTGESLLALALDQAGIPHLAYYDPGVAKIRYATRSLGLWTTVDIAPFPALLPPDELSLDLAVNSVDSSPLVAYVDTTQNRLFVGQPEAGQWTVKDIAAGGRLLNLAFGRDGHIHLVIVQGQSLVYWTETGSVWTSEVIGEPDPYIWNLSLALDSQEHPNVAYTGGEGSFQASRRGMNDWQVDPLPFPNIEALALGRADEPHLLITRAEPQSGRPPFVLVSLLLAELESGVWSETPLHQEFDWAVQPDLVVDEMGGVHIAYHDVTGRLHYQRRDDQGRMIHEILPGTDGPISLAVTAGQQPQPRLAHFHQTLLTYSMREEIPFEHQGHLPIILVALQPD